MHILITGAAGMIGRKLTARLVNDGALNGHAIEKLTLTDVTVPDKPVKFSGGVESFAADIDSPDTAPKAIADRPDVIFHLAAVVSGEAETDFEKGIHVNLDGSRALIEAVRAVGDGYCPRLVFTSSIAVFGAPFPDAIPDEFHHTPLTSYGTQKAIIELLLADYTRRGFVDGVGIRLPTINVRPGKPNKAASGFFSSIIREPLAGQEAAWLAHQSDLARRGLHGRRANRGAAPYRRRRGRGAHSPRTGSAGVEDCRRLAAALRSAPRACAGF
jgi:nucleoside-diphosphate-sugar epimerase